MIALYIYLSGAFLTALTWILMLKRVCPNPKLYWRGIWEARGTIASLGLLWFVIVPIIGFYLAAKKIGRIIYRLSNGRLAKGAM